MSGLISALVIGGSGCVGKALVGELLRSPDVGSVVCIGRTPIKVEDIQVDGHPDESVQDKQEKLKNVKVDFENLGETLQEENFAGVNAAFCCLGSTIKKAGSQEKFRHIDHDYVVNAARILKAGGVNYFGLVTSIGADETSGNFYLKTKGEVEHSVRDVGFERVSVFRPALLITPRNESRLGESIAQTVVPWISWAFPKRYREIKVETVARAMIFDALSVQKGEDKESFGQFDSDVLHVMAAKL